MRSFSFMLAALKRKKTTTVKHSFPIHRLRLPILPFDYLQVLNFLHDLSQPGLGDAAEGQRHGAFRGGERLSPPSVGLPLDSGPPLAVAVLQQATLILSRRVGGGCVVGRGDAKRRACV